MRVPSPLKDMCCNAVINMTIQFGPEIDTDDAVLDYLSAVWDIIHRLLGRGKNQPYVKLISHVNYLGCPDEYVATYNRLKILFVAKHNAFLFDDFCSFSPILKNPGPEYRWFGECNRVTKLCINTSEQSNIWPLIVILRSCQYLEILSCNIFLPCQIFDALNSACFTSLKSIQLIGEAGENFYTEHFLKYFLGIENQDKLYSNYRHYLEVALQAHNDVSKNCVAHVPFFANSIYAWNRQLKRYVKDLVKASSIIFPNIENIEILSTKIDDAALVLALIMLPNLTHLLVNDAEQLSRAFFLFYFLRTTLQFGLYEIKIKKLRISHDQLNWWTVGNRHLKNIYGFKEIEVYSSPTATSDILIDVKDFPVFHTVSSVKVNIQYNSSFDSLLTFLRIALSVNHLTELNIESIEASATDKLVLFLKYFKFLYTLRLTVQGRGTRGLIFNQMSILSIRKLYLSTIQPCSTDEVMCVMKYFKVAKFVHLTVATCKLVSSLAYNIGLNFRNLEILCIKPFCCCHRCSLEMNSLRSNSHMQTFAWNLLQRTRARFILEAEQYGISLDKLDHLKSIGWEIAKGFQMPD